MNTLASSSQQDLKPVNSAKVIGIIKAIAPRSFEKTFDGIATEQINHAMKLCLEGLTREQVNIGLAMVRDNGFCPDPAMFRKWCLGVTGFGTEQQRVKDSFKGKNAALANIVKWRINNKTVITNAEKEAYDRSYEMFNGIEYSSNYERKEYQAHASFKDNYDEVVREFAEKNIRQEPWNKPVAIERKTQSNQSQEPLTDEQIEKNKAMAKQAIANLKNIVSMDSR